MKYSITAFVLTAAVGALAPATIAGTQKPASAPVVITPPAIPDGSNFSRAPFPAARPQNDVTPPKGEAFDQNLPPNTPSTTPEPEAPPPPRFAILQPRGEPGLMPTGPALASASAGLDAARMQTAINSSAFENRDAIVDSVRARMHESDRAIAGFRRTENRMSETGRSQFQAAADDAKAKEKALQRSLKSAAHASAADWEAARAQLAADYQAYADALARIDAAAGVGPIR